MYFVRAMRGCEGLRSYDFGHTRHGDAPPPSTHRSVVQRLNLTVDLQPVEVSRVVHQKSQKLSGQVLAVVQYRHLSNEHAIVSPSYDQIQDMTAGPLHSTDISIRKTPFKIATILGGGNNLEIVWEGFCSSSSKKV